MSARRRADCEKLKRRGRHVFATPRFVHTCRGMRQRRLVTSYADASRVVSGRARARFSGGRAMAAHWIKAWSKIRNLVVLPSAESGFCAPVKA